MDRTIRVTGKGVLQRTPDMVRIRIDLHDTDKEYAKALERSLRHAEEVKQAFSDLGFQKSDLKTLSFRVDTEYESYQDETDHVWKQRLLGYRAVHVLKVEFARDPDRLGRVLHMIQRLPAEPEFQLEYFLRDAEAAKAELLSEAVKDSRRKAAVLADAAGVKLGEILNIDYSFGTIEFVSRPMNKMAMPTMAAGMAMEEDRLSFDIDPDDIRVEDTVTVIWEIL